MKLTDRTFTAWATVALTFGFAIFLLASPTGSHVQSAMEHSKRLSQSNESAGFMAVQASSADPRLSWLQPDSD